MSLELVLTYVTLGAYLFLTIETFFKMLVRYLNFDDYSRWQRHLYAIWGILMLFISLQLIWDVNVYYYPQLTWDSYPHLYVQNCSLLVMPLAGMVIWTLTTHRLLKMPQILAHMLPFVAIISILYIVDQYWTWFILVLYAYCCIYAINLLRICIKNYRQYNLRLQQTYADTKYRTLTWMIHLIWVFGFTFCLYVYYAYVIMDEDYIYYFLVTLIWYYINWNICHVRETNVLENAQLEEEELAKEAEQASIGTTESKEKVQEVRQSLRELTKQRLEETLEEVCLSRRLYLNPELTVMDLASELNTNRTYVSQYFSEHHTTFLKFINDLRVEHAMFQIKNTNHRMSDIMFESGFRHAETFRRAFQNRYNMDPRDIVRNPGSSE